MAIEIWGGGGKGVVLGVEWRISACQAPLNERIVYLVQIYKQLCVSFFVSVVHAVENVGALLVQTLTARPVDCVSERLPTGASPYVKIAAMGDPCKAAQWTSA